MTYGELETVRLCDAAAGLQATFVPAAGMLCSSLRHGGEELLAQRAGVAGYVARGKTMGIPLLYPWANRLAGFDYSVAGAKVAVPHDPERLALDANGLPIHGLIGGRMGWEVIRPPGGDTQSPAGAALAPGREMQSLAARLSWNDARPDLFEVFPFRHDLHYEASLADGRLEIGLTVRACGEDVVPVAFGFHPYLSLPDVQRERWRVQLPPMRHLALDAQQIPLSPADSLPAQRFELAAHEFDDGFDMVANPSRFALTAGERSITLELLEGYPCAQVYAPRPGEFICFEPMTAPANALRSGAGLRLLAPGESHRARFAVGVPSATTCSRDHG